jgi:hypothetical protein
MPDELQTLVSSFKQQMQYHAATTRLVLQHWKEKSFNSVTNKQVTYDPIDACSNCTRLGQLSAVVIISSTSQHQFIQSHVRNFNQLRTATATDETVQQASSCVREELLQLGSNT